LGPRTAGGRISEENGDKHKTSSSFPPASPLEALAVRKERQQQKKESSGQCALCKMGPPIFQSIPNLEEIGIKKTMGKGHGQLLHQLVHWIGIIYSLSINAEMDLIYIDIL
jgi:hypothetical protein